MKFILMYSIIYSFYVYKNTIHRVKTRADKDYCKCDAVKEEPPWEGSSPYMRLGLPRYISTSLWNSKDERKWMV